MGKYKILIIIILGLLVYGNALFNGFVWDDEEMILNNPQFHSLSYLPNLFAGSTFNSGGAGNLSGLYYKPLMMASFVFLYSFFGPNAFPFHLFQITIHIGSAILVYLLLRKYLKRDTLSFVLALVFLVHPINVESVVYIAALQEILFLFFGLLALLIGSPVLSAGLLLLSLLSKETGLVMALLVFLSLLLFKKQKVKRFLLSMSVSVGIYAFLRFGVAHIFLNKHGLTPISTMPLTSRLMNIPKIILSYLTTFFWPANLVIDQQWAVKAVTWPDFWLPLIIDAVFAGLTFLFLVWLWKSKSHWVKIYLFFLLWFWLALGFHLQLFPLDLTVSDRWFYLPLVGLLGMSGVIFTTKGAEIARPISRAARSLSALEADRAPSAGISKLYVLTAPVVLAVIIGLLSLRTVVRTFDWRSGMTLYGHDIKNSYDSFDIENNYAVELFRIGKFDEAGVHFQKSVDLAPNWWTNFNNLGAYYERKGDLVKAEKLYKQSIDNGNYYLAVENYGNVLVKEKKYPEAIDFLEKSQRILPGNTRIALTLTFAYYQTGQYTKAEAAAQYLVRLDPSPENESLLQQVSAKVR